MTQTIISTRFLSVIVMVAILINVLDRFTNLTIEQMKYLSLFQSEHKDKSWVKIEEHTINIVDNDFESQGAFHFGYTRNLLHIEYENMHMNLPW